MRLFIALTTLGLLLQVRFTLAASDLRIVALTGAPAIGADEPFVTFDQRAINDRGDVAFIGLVNDEQLTGNAQVDLSVILGADMGVWIDEFGQQQRNVLITNSEGSATPRILTVQALDMNSQGQLAVRVLQDDGLAVWSDHDGSMVRVAANGDRLPDLDSGLYWPRGNQLGAKFAMLETSQVMIGDRQGHVWLTAPGGHEFYRIGTDIPPGMEKSAIGPYARNSFDEPAINSHGDYVLCDRFSNDTSTPDSMWIRTDQSLELVARLEELIPDDSTGATFRDFQRVVLDSAADLAFLGRLNDPSGEDAFGIFLRSDDNLRMIAHTSRPLPGVGGSTIVTEPTFWLHGAIALSDNSAQLAFRAVHKGGDDSGETSQGIWRYDGEFLHKVVVVGDFANGPYRDHMFASVGEPVINEYGQLVFAATLNDGTESLTGVWGTTASGQLHEILHAGDVIEVAPGDLRVVRRVDNFQDLGLSESSAFNNRGEVLLHVSFEDFSQAIIVSRAIALGNIAGNDLNGDGVLDIQDIDHLTRLIHNGMAPASFDRNNDQVVDSLDLSAYLIDAFDSAIGDSTLDGRFSSDDLLAVFAPGNMKTPLTATRAGPRVIGMGTTTATQPIWSLPFRPASTSRGKRLPYPNRPHSH